MIITMQAKATAAQIGAIFLAIQSLGGTPYSVRSNGHTVVVGIGLDRALATDRFAAMPGVARVADIEQPYKLASRAAKAENSRVQVGDVIIGGRELVVIAGLCPVESGEQLLETALAVRKAGGKILYGGTVAPRTAPRAQRQSSLRRLERLAEVRRETGLAVMAEVSTPESVPLAAEYADMLQIGVGSMQNYTLLHAVGRVQRPVLLRRGVMNNLQEWLMAAEYILSSGNDQVLLCEGGIRTFTKMTRYTFDLSALPLLKLLTHLPVIADPGHATGRWNLVPPLARAAIAAGADGLMVAVHAPPEAAFPGEPQSLGLAHFAEMMASLRAIAGVSRRTL